MSAVIFSNYLALNVTLFCSFLFLWFVLRGRYSARDELRIHYGLMGWLAVLAFVITLFPAREIFPPIARVWSDLPPRAGHPMQALTQPLGLSTAISSTVFEQGYSWAFALFFTTVILMTFQLMHSLFQLWALTRKSLILRQYGRIRIGLNAQLASPISYRLLHLRYVILPESFVERREDFQLAVRHELQHHRQGDTHWVFALWFVRSICFLNPAAYLWSRWISEVQEFACDEALLARQRVRPQAYIRCLAEAALTAFAVKDQPVCATGMVFRSPRHLLNRRIDKMLNIENGVRRKSTIGISLLLALFTTASAFASRGLIQDRRVSRVQAEKMALQARSTSQFPIVVNDSVLKWLNRFMGTPEGRLRTREALARLDGYRPTIAAKLQGSGMPEELMAVPIVESGYKNLPESNQRGRGAGLWMFIKTTARRFGMRVDPGVDDRLNVSQETDAAIQYLHNNFDRFEDWQLSLMAYNIGEGRLQQEIDRLGTRDPWLLIQNGVENDTDYLAKVQAAILIMKNPHSVD